MIKHLDLAGQDSSLFQSLGLLELLSEEWDLRQHLLQLVDLLLLLFLVSDDPLCWRLDELRFHPLLRSLPLSSLHH